MKSLKWIGAAALLTLLAAPGVLAATRVGYVPSHRATKAQRAAQTIDNTGRMNVNNLDMVVTNHGSLAYDLLTGNAGLIYPRGTIKTAVFAAGLWIGAKVGGEIRAAVGEYSQEYTPGPMAGGTFQSDNPSFHNFRITRGSTLTGTDLADYIAQGGPLDSTGAPQLLGDATLWSVFNDADPGVHTNEAGSTAPLGVEVQQSVFAYNRSGALGNIIFVKWKIINKGANTLDSTYVSVWSDPDLGGATDDLVGCDTTLSLGYCYNATNSDGIYGSTPPAVGYDFFKGPSVGGNPLGMTSFNKYVNGTDPSSQVETYNYMSGLNKDGSPIHVLNDTTLAVTKFQVSGTNLNAASTATNWLDSNPGDRRLQLSSGPFTMAPGDTQEVVTAIIIGQGTDRISSVNDMKNKDTAAQTVFDLNFDIPQPPPSPTVYVQPLDRAVRLVWDRSAVGTHSANAFLGQDFVFEGYRVWQLPSAGGGTPKVIATFDQAGNAIGPIYSDLFNSSVGAVERTLVINGTDEGLRFQLEITNDAIRGGRLVNYKDYYFAVTAFSYDSLNVAPFTVGVNQVGIVSDVLESALNVVHAVPKGSNAVLSVVPIQTTGTPVGGVTVGQLTPSIGDSLYRVVVLPGGTTYNLYNATSGDTIVFNQPLGTDLIINGFNLATTTPTNPMGVVQLVGGSGLLGSTSVRDVWHNPTQTDVTGTFAFTNFVDPTDITWFDFNDTIQHDYLVHVLPDTTQYAWKYNGGDVSSVATFKVPFEIYDLGQCTFNDASDDTKMSVMIRDLNGNGRWDWGDAAYVRMIPYANVNWTNPGTTSLDYTIDPDTDAASQTLGRFTLQAASGATLPVDSRMVVGTLCAGDVFEFRTVPAGVAAGTVVGRDLTKIRAVPNPYYAHSQYELSQFDRVLKFTNIPGSREVTIRIFNLAGDLVRTIRRSAQAGNDMSSSQINWDLNTENRLPVESGIYIARIEVAGIGATTLRVAVFVEQERLDNF